jgi:hypothetical protein
MFTSRLTSRLMKYGNQLPNKERQSMINRAMEIQMGPLRWLVDIPCSLFFGSNLKMLATVYMSDKWNTHWYAPHYEDHFRHLRHKKINILEIGIGGYDNPRRGGGSLRMWRTFFRRGRVHGVDIYDKSAHDGRRIKTFQGSQRDPVFLQSLVNEIGKIDIIIDDGSHQNEHVLFTFHHMFPHLADNGVYVVEDTQTSYWPDYGGETVERNSQQTIMGFFKSLIDGLNWVEFKGEYSPNYFDLNIKSVAFYHNLIFISKGSSQDLGVRNRL